MFLSNRKKIVSLLLLLSLCSCNNQLTGTWENIIADNVINSNNNIVSPFNTIMYLKYFFKDKEDNIKDEKINEISSIYKNEVTRLHKLYDRHNSYLDESNELLVNLKTINDSYGTNKEIKCDKELYDLLKFSIEAFEFTNGYFNIFTGHIISFWEDCFDNANNFNDLTSFDPYFNESAKQELETLVESVPNSLEKIQQQLTFNDENLSVTFNKLDFNLVRPSITFGGIAKGKTNDYIKEKLINNNYTNGYLISGSSSISSLSKPIYSKKNKGQKISVINPLNNSFSSQQYAFSIQFKNEFNFSTSGNHIDGKYYSFKDENDNLVYRHHIINPYTGYPLSYHHSISIYSSTFSNAMLDVLSTTFMNLSLEEGIELKKEILKKFPNNDLELFYLENLNDGIGLYYTSNINDTLEIYEGVKVLNEK